MTQDQQRVGIIGAMEEEVAYLKERLEHVDTERIAGMEVFTGTLDGIPVALVKCGIGKVNAALCAQMLVLRFNVGRIVNTGVAGSLDARINIGDLVVSTDAIEHDFDVCALGYEPGQIPDIDTWVFKADERLREGALAAVAAIAPEVHAFEGRVVSGDQFVASAERKDFIVSNFAAICTEMEGAAIAHACSLLDVPFVIVRAISDKADGSAHMDYREFEEEAARRCAGIVEHMVTHL